MQKYDLKLGSHVKCSKDGEYLIGSMDETINNDANAMMVFTGPPQNSRRVDIDKFNVEEFSKLQVEHNITNKEIIVHAPYIINLANTIKKSTMEFGVEILKNEIARAEAINASVIVLHPGSSVKGDIQESLNQIADCLNQIITKDQKVKIALETMSGKGTEVGVNFDQLKTIIDQIKLKDQVGVCWDTCHLWDGGYDLTNNLDGIIKEFDKKIGLDKILCIHLNDSKNNISAHKDRHANIGYGMIGFESLVNIVYHPQLNGIVKILETPYVDGNSPYREEIKMIKNKQFNDVFSRWLT